MKVDGEITFSFQIPSTFYKEKGINLEGCRLLFIREVEPDSLRFILSFYRARAQVKRERSRESILSSIDLRLLSSSLLSCFYFFEIKKQEGVEEEDTVIRR